MRARPTTTHRRLIALLVLTLIAAACGSTAAEVQSTEDTNLELGAPPVITDTEQVETGGEDDNELVSIVEEIAVSDGETDEPIPPTDSGEGPIDPVAVDHDYLHSIAGPGGLMIGSELIGTELGASLALDPDSSLPVLTVDYGEATAEIFFTLPHYDVGEAILTFANGDVIELDEPSLGFPPTAITLEQPIPGSDSEWVFFGTSFLAGTTSFEIEGNRAILTGRIGTNTFGQIQHLIDEHPEVDTLVLADIEGAVEDQIADTFGRVDPWQFTENSSALIRDHGFTTVIPADGRVADSGLLLFAGGAERIVEATDAVFFHEQEIGEITVRAQCCGLTEADLNAEIPLDQFSRVHEAAVRRWSRFLGEEAGTAITLHLAQQAIRGPHELSRVELDAFNLITTPAALAVPSTPAPIVDDFSFGSLDLNVMVDRPEELLAVIADRFNDAQAEVQEGRELATPWVVVHRDQTLGLLLIEGGLDDAVRGKLATIVLEGDDSFGWVATDVSNRYICSRGISDGLCL